MAKGKTENMNKLKVLFFGTVIEVHKTSPNFMRLRVLVDDIASLDESVLHFRLLLPLPDVPTTWPKLDSTGRVSWPDGKNGVHSRVYTIKELNVRDQTLDFDVFLHDRGFTCRWALEAVGKQIGLLCLDVNWMPEQNGPLVMAGDETAFPAIGRICACLDRNASGTIILSAACLEDVPSLDLPDGVGVRVLQVPAGGSELLDEVKGVLSGQDLNPFVWFAAERSVAVSARHYLIAEGVPQDRFVCAAYWVKNAKEESAAAGERQGESSLDQPSVRSGRFHGKCLSPCTS